jgi:hypothetical protein
MRIRDSIQSYLNLHPDAADTVDGVSVFWLPEDRRDATLAEITLALRQLVDAGQLVHSVLPGGVVWYAGPVGGSDDTNDTDDTD